MSNPFPTSSRQQDEIDATIRPIFASAVHLAAEASGVDFKSILLMNFDWIVNVLGNVSMRETNRLLAATGVAIGNGGVDTDQSRYQRERALRTLLELMRDADVGKHK